MAPKQHAPTHHRLPASSTDELGGEADEEAPLRFAFVLAMVALFVSIYVFCRLCRTSSQREEIFYQPLALKEFENTRIGGFDSGSSSEREDSSNNSMAMQKRPANAQTSPRSAPTNAKRTP